MVVSKQDDMFTLESDAKHGSGNIVRTCMCPVQQNARPTGHVVNLFPESVFLMEVSSFLKRMTCFK